MNGKVKFFNTMKGFGFIAGDDGKEYFVHQTGLQQGVTLGEGDSVTFDVTEGDRGPKAVNVGKGKIAQKQASNDDSVEEESEELDESEDLE